VVACLLVDPRFGGSNPAKGNGFLRAIKSVARLTSKGQVNPSVPCRRRFYGILKYPMSKK
jgi:hypothetical protein